MRVAVAVLAFMVTLGMHASTVFAHADDYAPNLDGGRGTALWEVRFFKDESTIHEPISVTTFCFKFKKISGTHRVYLWNTIDNSISGEARQEADHVSMTGMGQLPGVRDGGGSFSSVWSIFSGGKGSLETRGAGHAAHMITNKEDQTEFMNVHWALANAGACQ